MGGVAHFRNFCMREPKPALARIIVGSDSKDIPIEPGTEWIRLAETIDSQDPDLLELYDANGMLLRSDRRKGGARASSGVVTPEPLSGDPETARITHFANLLHRAYADANQRIFDVVQLQLDSNREALARAQRAEQERADSERENALLRAALKSGGNDEEGGSHDNLLATLLQAFASGAASGKKKPEEPIS